MIMMIFSPDRGWIESAYATLADLKYHRDQIDIMRPYGEEYRAALDHLINVQEVIESENYPCP